MKDRWLLCLGILTFFLNYSSGHFNEFKLSDSKILLPRSSYNSINYTIKGSPSICHEWSTSSPEVVSILAIYEGGSKQSCSHEAVITSIWQSNYRITATIYAKNKATGHVVNCDVIVDLIDKLEIETRTQQLYLHETPEALIARGYDGLGNTFSTLDGIPFEWNIESTFKSEYQNVLRFITWTESEYTTPRLIGNLESQGLHGYMQLVSGLKTGSANVSLTLRDDKLKILIHSLSVKLLVMSKAELFPKVDYLVPYGQMSYKILVYNQGALQDVTLPSNQYYLKINKSEIASLQTDSSVVTALKYGHTEVILIDKNINEEFQHPFSILYVREPGFLSFYLYPGNNQNQWVLQSQYNNTYTIIVRPFDLNSHPIHMSDNLRLKTVIPTKYFEVLFSSTNGTYHIVKAIHEGIVTLKSTFGHIVLDNGTLRRLPSPIEGSQDLIIYPPIKVYPSGLVLPLLFDVANDIKSNQVVPGHSLSAKGGSGEYKWMIEDDQIEIVSVNQDGFVMPKKLGKVNVVAADQRNLLNRGYSTITVDTVASIHLLLDEKIGAEMLVEEVLDIPVKAFTTGGKEISFCHWLPFKSVVSEKRIIQVIEVLPVTKNDSSCAKLRVKGLQPGFSNLQLVLSSVLTNNSRPTELIATITLGVYYPATFIEPDFPISYVALKSVRKLRVINGPLPWILEPSSYQFELLETSYIKSYVNTVQLEVDEPNSQYKSGSIILALQCVNSGEIDVKVKISNKPTKKNPYPRHSMAKMRLQCTVPVRMKLIPVISNDEVINKTGMCPFQNMSTHQQYTINNKNPLKIEVQFMNKEGQLLDRSNSLAIKVLIKHTLKNKNVEDVVESSHPLVHYGNEVHQTYFYLIPKVSGISTGELIIDASCTSYRTLRAAGLFSSSESFILPKLETHLHIRLTRSVSVEPKVIKLFQHNDVKASFSVMYGSGYFNINRVTPHFLEVKPKSLSSQQIEEIEDQKSLSESIEYEVTQRIVHLSNHFDYSKMTAGRIDIVDYCFSSSPESLSHDGEVYYDTAQVNIEIVRPFKLQLLSMNKVQIGSEMFALVKVYDENNHEFPSEYLHMMQLQMYTNDKQPYYSSNSPSPASNKDQQAPSSSLSDIISIDYDQQHSITTSRNGYLVKIKGETIGLTTLHASLTNTKPFIISNQVDIEVFPKIQLLPRQQVLLPGAELQVTTIGGPTGIHDPTPDFDSTTNQQNNQYNSLKIRFGLIHNTSLNLKQARLEFVKPISNKGLVKSMIVEYWSYSGLVRGVQPGSLSMEIRAELSEIDPARDNERVVISQAEGRLGVVQIQSVSIHTPIQTVLFSNNLPMWTEFHSSNNDLSHLPINGISMTSALSGDHNDDRKRPLLSLPVFKWGLNPPQGVLVKLEHFLKKIDINVDKIHRHSGMRISTLSSTGKQTIELTISNIPHLWLAGQNSKQSLTATLDLNIISRLHMVHPNIAYGRSNRLLVPPDTRVNLVSSLDNIGQVSYSISPLNSKGNNPLDSSKIISDNILETGSLGYHSNQAENFILHVHATTNHYHKLQKPESVRDSGKRQHPSRDSMMNPHGNQSMIIFVTVKQPAYSMITPHVESSNLFERLSIRGNKQQPLRLLPLGGPFEFQITSHDEFGDVFDVTPELNHFSVRTHRLDRLSVSLRAGRNSLTPSQSQLGFQTLQTQMLNSGANTLQLYFTRHGYMTDIISMPSGPSIYLPGNVITQELHILEGMRLKYASPMKDNKGLWYASDNGLVTVIKDSGVLHGNMRGVVTVYYTPSQHTSNDSTITNEKSTKITKSKPVLVGQQLHILPTTTLNLVNFDFTNQHLEGPLLTFYSRSGKQDVQIPISLSSSNFKSHMIVPLYLQGSLRDTEKINIDKSETLTSVLSNSCLHNLIKCSIESKHSQLITLFRARTIALPSKRNTQYGIQQWACMIEPVANLDDVSIALAFQALTDTHGYREIHTAEYQLSLTARLMTDSDNAVGAETVMDQMSIPVVTGYFLLPVPDNIVLTSSGEVSTSIRLIVPPSLRPESHQISVESTKPYIVEVLAPRRLDQQSAISAREVASYLNNKNNIWIYPIKAGIIQEGCAENVSILIRLPATNQQNRVKMHVSIPGPGNRDKPFVVGYDKVSGSQYTDENNDPYMYSYILKAMFYVLFTVIIAVMVVIIVNMFSRAPMRLSSSSSNLSVPWKQSYSSPRRVTTTQHIFSTSPGSRQGTSPANSNNSTYFMNGSLTGNLSQHEDSHRSSFHSPSYMYKN